MLKELESKKKKVAKPIFITRKFFMYLFIIVGLFTLLLPSLIFATMMTQYLPDSSLRLAVDDTRIDENKSTHSGVTVGETYSALTYNTGYNGYNQDMHFFMDGDGQFFFNGQGTAESKDAVLSSLNGIDRILTANHDSTVFVDSWDDAPTYLLRGSHAYMTTYNDDGSWKEDLEITNLDDLDLNDGTFDFVALQEQDRDSTRSKYVDEYSTLRDMKISTDASVTDPNQDKSVTTTISDMYDSIFAYNFAVPFIPAPLADMHGQVLGGETTLSKFTILNDDENYPTRESLANITSFPLNLFELKRCATITRYDVLDSSGESTGKQFVFINCHFANYDKSGVIRRKQLLQVNDLFESEIAKGNYVVLGADWNQTLPGCYGYEGSDIYGVDGETEDPDDPAIAPWDYNDFNYSGSNAKNPDVYNDFEYYPQYISGESYKKGDVVSYYSENDPTNKPLDGLQYYMTNYQTHNYQALVDNPTEAPIVYDTESGTYKKSNQWRYYLQSDYQNVSLSKKVREELLPVSTDTSDSRATLYTIHAIPTLRNAGIQYRNESKMAHDLGSDYTGGHSYKSTIDGFLVSNNIHVNFTFGFDTNFKYSDHNPVGISFYLIPEE